MQNFAIAVDDEDADRGHEQDGFQVGTLGLRGLRTADRFLPAQLQRLFGQHLGRDVDGGMRHTDELAVGIVDRRIGRTPVHVFEPAAAILMHFDQIALRRHFLADAGVDGNPNRSPEVLYPSLLRIVGVVREDLEQGPAEDLVAPTRDRTQEGVVHCDDLELVSWRQQILADWRRVERSVEETMEGMIFRRSGMAFCRVRRFSRALSINYHPCCQ